MAHPAPKFRDEPLGEPSRLAHAGIPGSGAANQSTVDVRSIDRASHTGNPALARRDQR